MYCYDCGRACTTDGASQIPVCPQCGPRWKLVRNAPCADVLIVRDGRALLGRRAREPYRGCWELPGGFSERGEHPADTARREVAEELGVAVRLTALLGFYLDDYLDDVVEVVTFVGEIDGEPVPDPREITEVRWFAPTDPIRPDEIVPSHAVRMRDWAQLEAGKVPPAVGLDPV